MRSWRERIVPDIQDTFNSGCFVGSPSPLILESVPKEQYRVELSLSCPFWAYKGLRSRASSTHEKPKLLLRLRRPDVPVASYGVLGE